MATVRLTNVQEIAIDAGGKLRVRPEVSAPSYPLIYRAGNGLRWEVDEAAFVAAEPGRWNHAELLAHILSTVRAECDDVLHLTDRTRWVNVAPEQRSELVAVFNGGNLGAV